MKSYFCISLVFLTIIIFQDYSSAIEPEEIVLTWQDDTKTTMTVTWRTEEPDARTYGMNKIEKIAREADTEIEFTEIRNNLLENGWQDAGYESPEYAFAHLAAGVMNYAQSDADFAYRILKNNWSTYSEEVGLEEELLPDRVEWNEIQDSGAENKLHYTVQSDAEVDIDEYNTLKPETYTFAETAAWLHRVQLNDLEPGTTYEVILERDGQQADSFIFRTAPTEKREITFIAGADTQSETRERKEMTELAATFDPEFVMIAGDLVMNGMAENEWDQWFKEWHELMITDEGRRVPVVPALGNHDVRGWIMGDFETDAAFYANRFNLPDPQRFYALEYGPGLALITLDSGHTSAFNEELDWFKDTGYYEGENHRVRDSHTGEQRDWLEQTLAEFQNSPWIMGHYHINAFATSPHYWEKPRYGRPLMHDHWIPLFEEYGVDLIHEGHGHRMKRTHPIRDMEINEDGVVYIGEGGWGTHMGEPEDMWFVDDKGSDHHFWKLTLEEGWETLKGVPIKWIDGEAVKGQEFTIEQR